MKEALTTSATGIAAALWLSALCANPASAAETQLYETGPGEDASFLRFVDATGKPLDVVPQGRSTRITLDSGKPATDFFPVKANTAIEGALEQGAARTSVSVKVEAGAFSTVIALPDGKGGLRTQVVSEKPDDFNGLKASLAFYNVDPACAGAGLYAAGRDVAIFKDVAIDTLQRRAVNPVALSVQARCAGKAAGTAADLGQLQAGQRYSVFAVPGASGTTLVQAVDNVAR
jgi:hypothetical protein